MTVHFSCFSSSCSFGNSGSLFGSFSFSVVDYSAVLVLPVQDLPDLPELQEVQELLELLELQEL